jgi:dTDP-glucose pyrophosphorylase
MEGLKPPHQVLILVGGLGTRLGELTKETPKPLLEIGGRPFLDYVIEDCVRFGFRHIVLLAGYRGERIETYAQYIRGSLPSHVHLDFVVEPSPLGTAGAIGFAADRLASRFFLLNGDSYFDANWLDLLLSWRTDGLVAAMALRRVPDTGRYGVVRLEGDRVSGFDERGDGSPGLINGGIYLFHRSIVSLLPREGSLERDVLPRLSAGGAVRARVYDGYFLDIGVPDAFARAQVEMPDRRHRAALFLHGGATIGRMSGDRSSAMTPREDAIAGLKQLNDLGHFAFFVTDRDAKEGGARVDREPLQDHLRARGAHLDDIRYCPRSGSDGPTAASRVMRDLMQAWPVVPEQSIIVGSDERSVAVARAVGLPWIVASEGVDQIVARHFAKRAVSAGAL